MSGDCRGGAHWRASLYPCGLAGTDKLEELRLVALWRRLLLFSRETARELVMCTPRLGFVPIR
jgi:hypothetical protein